MSDRTWRRLATLAVVLAGLAGCAEESPRRSSEVPVEAGGPPEQAGSAGPSSKIPMH